jgi:hypothetical protein
MAVVTDKLILLPKLGRSEPRMNQVFLVLSVRVKLSRPKTAGLVSISPNGKHCGEKSTVFG